MKKTRILGALVPFQLNAPIKKTADAGALPQVTSTRSLSYQVGTVLVSGLIAGAAVALLGASGGASGSPGNQGTAPDQHPSALFLEYCAKCHGQDGTGNTPKGKQLMARDFTDAEWQSSKKDDQLIKQVTEGGEDMPPFGKKLTKEQIEGLVKNDVRGFGKKK